MNDNYYQRNEWQMLSMNDNYYKIDVFNRKIIKGLSSILCIPLFKYYKKRCLKFNIYLAVIWVRG